MAREKRKHLAGKIFGWLIVLAVLAVPGAYFYFREPTIDVTTAPLTRGHVEQTITAISAGTVTPRIEAMIAAGTIGKVIAVPVEKGDRVKKDDVLVELDHAELDAQVELAEANLRVGQSRLQQAKIAATIYEEIARTRVSQAEAQFNVAKQDFGRIKALSDRKAVSDSDFEKINMALRVARETDAAARAGQKETLVHQEEIVSTEAAIEQLEAAVTLAKSMRDKAYVRAPFDAVVAKVFVEVGEAVGSGMGGSLGSAGMATGGGMGMGANTAAMPSTAGMSVSSPMALAQLVQDADLYVEAPFDEANISQIKVGQKTKIGLDAYRDEEFEGVVEFISPTVSRNLDLSRTFEVDVRILSGREKFVPGMSADVIVVADAKDDVLFVPSESLIREEEAYVVESGRAVRRQVTVGIGNWQTMEVLDGLNEGETLVTSVGIKELKNGVKVNVVDALEQ